VLTVVALGGNALTRPGERGTVAEQRANLRATCEAMRPLLGDGDLVVTHGNGPQVGNELVRQERAADEVPPNVFQPPNCSMKTVMPPVNSSASALTSGTWRQPCSTGPAGLSEAQNA